MKSISSFFLSNNKSDEFVRYFNPKSAYLYYLKYRKNLLSDQIEKIGIEFLLEEFQKKTISSVQENPIVTHLFYELGYKFLKLDELIDEQPLAIQIEYFNHETIQLAAEPIQIEVKKENDLKFSQYEKAFKLGREHLLNGDCYQFNLTHNFDFKLSTDDHLKIMKRIWSHSKNRGAFAHCSFFPQQKMSFISNSPECLFKKIKINNKYFLDSFPIKGTQKIEKNKSWKAAWKKLIEDKKNQAELFMIADLIRNDLSSIELPQCKILKKKAPLLVPLLVHQYCHLRVELSEKVNLLEILQALFPGGSITGAPKKRVMSILWKLENKTPRGFYCGSTIVHHQSLLTASINIRSSFLVGKNLKYGSGGGITLKSNPQKELDEMKLKMKSFLDLL